MSPASDAPLVLAVTSTSVSSTALTPAVPIVTLPRAFAVVSLFVVARTRALTSVTSPPPITTDPAAPEPEVWLSLVISTCPSNSPPAPAFARTHSVPVMLISPASPTS